MNYGDDIPCALVVARQKELQQNQNIMYNLVKPTKDNPNLIESNLKLANVLPKNRIYRMETPEELDLFRNELLKRPLVLQCTVDGGPGMACMKWFPNLDCRIVRFSENYIVLLNQNHPKILARLQMGLEVAQRAIQRSQPFILTFTFNDVIERLYPEILREFSDIIGPQDIVNCHDGEIIIHYAQESRMPHLKDALKVKDISFAFEDLSSLDMKVDTLRSAHARQRRSLPLEQGELVSILKGWRFGDLETSDLLNAYAEISNGPTQGSPSYPRTSSQPPSYERAILLPVHNQAPKQSSKQYGYSYDSHPSPVTASHHSGTDPHDRSMTSRNKKVIRPPDDFESDNLPYINTKEFVNVGFHDEPDTREQKHRFAPQYPQSDYASNNYPQAVSHDNVRVEFHDKRDSREEKHEFAAHYLQSNFEDKSYNKVQGKSSHAQNYDVHVIGHRGLDKQSLKLKPTLPPYQQEEEEDETTQDGMESFI